MPEQQRAFEEGKSNGQITFANQTITKWQVHFELRLPTLCETYDSPAERYCHQLCFDLCRFVVERQRDR